MTDTEPGRYIPGIDKHGTLKEKRRANAMTIKELAKNWIENDRTGDFAREISEQEAEQFIGWMDTDTLDDLEDEITPEAFASAWNELIKGI